MDWIARNIATFRDGIALDQLPTMVERLRAYWAGANNLAPFFDWPTEYATFSDHVEQLLERLDADADSMVVGDVLCEVLLATAAAWHWEVGIGRLDEILDIMKMVGDRGRALQSFLSLGRKGERLAVPTVHVLHDDLCANMTRGAPFLHDRYTASCFANACAALFHSVPERCWKPDDHWKGRSDLAAHAVRLLEHPWDLDQIDESCRAGIFVWTAYHAYRADETLPSEQLEQCWRKAFGTAEFPPAEAVESLVYTRAQAYYDVNVRFRPDDVSSRRPHHPDVPENVVDFLRPGFGGTRESMLDELERRVAA